MGGDFSDEGVGELLVAYGGLWSVSWVDDGFVVEFEQAFNGIPVFQGYVRGVFSREGHLMRTTGLLAPGGRQATLGTEPELSASEAVVSAAHSISIDLPTDSFSHCHVCRVE